MATQLCPNANRPTPVVSAITTKKLNAPRRLPSMRLLNPIGIDLAKNLFQVHGVDQRGKVVLRRQLRRGQVMDVFAQREPCPIGMEACRSAHAWVR
jgi:hypothetical protein